MGLILDLAVIAVTLVVLGSLGLLAWTLAVSATQASERARVRIAHVRESVARRQARLAAKDTGGDTRSA